MTKPNNPGLCSTYVNLYVFGAFPSSYDECSGITTVPTGVPAGSVFPVGTTNIIWEITDLARNMSTCPQSVTVTDNEFPTIICPPNITVNTDPGQCSAYVNVETAVASDNCGISSFVNNFNAGGANASGVYPIGTTTVTFTATDPTNKTVTCSFNVTVLNSQSPEITLFGDNPYTIEACGTYTEFGATAFDACFGNVSGSIVIDASAVISRG